jgi:hypothetical protein
MNSRKVASIQDDREFYALSESIITFLKKLSHRNNKFKKGTTKATKNAVFLVFVKSRFFHCAQIISQ